MNDVIYLHAHKKRPLSSRAHATANVSKAGVKSTSRMTVSQAGEMLVIGQHAGSPADAGSWAPGAQVVLVVVDNLEERDRVVRLLTEAESKCGDRNAATPTAVIEIGELRIDRDARRVGLHGKPVPLTALEFKLLATLAERADQVQSRAALLNDVWGLNAKTDTRTIDVHVNRLRDKVGSAGRLIQCVRGVGYRLVQPTAANTRPAKPEAR